MQGISWCEVAENGFALGGRVHGVREMDYNERESEDERWKLELHITVVIKSNINMDRIYSVAKQQWSSPLISRERDNFTNTKGEAKSNWVTWEAKRDNCEDDKCNKCIVRRIGK